MKDYKKYIYDITRRDFVLDLNGDRIFVCSYCNKRLLSKEITLDHVIPKSKGGAGNLENLVISCSLCNSKKGNHLPAQSALFLWGRNFEEKRHSKSYKKRMAYNARKLWNQ